jgi:hypothetical protein
MSSSLDYTKTIRLEKLLKKVEGKDYLKDLQSIYECQSGAHDASYIGRLLLDIKFVKFIGRLPKLFRVYYER